MALNNKIGETIDVKRDIPHFEHLWESRNPDDLPQTKGEVWNKRADDWVATMNERQWGKLRIEDTGKWLRSHNLLNDSNDVIDIGCGPGRFVANFAKTCRHAVGTDISSRMLEHAAEHAASLGLDNVSFIECDFKRADIKALGWEKAFDLVFSSITPAVGGLESLKNMHGMSRKYCFNSCFVYKDNELENKVNRQIYGDFGERSQSHAHWFYALFNLLWLQGYYPETYYYKEHRNEKIAATRKEAEKFVSMRMRRQEPPPDEIEKVYGYFTELADTDGNISFQSDCWYGWLLWDVRIRTGR